MLRGFRVIYNPAHTVKGALAHQHIFGSAATAIVNQPVFAAYDTARIGQMPAEDNKEAGEFTGRIQVILCMLKLKFTSAIAPAACSRRFLGGRGPRAGFNSRPAGFCRVLLHARRYI